MLPWFASISLSFCPIFMLWILPYSYFSSRTIIFNTSSNHSYLLSSIMQHDYNYGYKLMRIMHIWIFLSPSLNHFNFQHTHTHTHQIALFSLSFCFLLLLQIYICFVSLFLCSFIYSLKCVWRNCQLRVALERV